MRQRPSQPASRARGGHLAARSRLYFSACSAANPTSIGDVTNWSSSTLRSVTRGGGEMNTSSTERALALEAGASGEAAGDPHPQVDGLVRVRKVDRLARCSLSQPRPAVAPVAGGVVCVFADDRPAASCWIQ